jgi:hypothetical protein
MSDHHFNPFVAKKYGIIEAILINSFIFWTRTNAAKEENYHDERFWCYGTPQYFTKFFVYLTPRQIKYALKKLVDSNALLIGNFNKKGYDKTAWYSLSDNILLELNLNKSCLQPLQILIEQICPIDRTNLSYGQDKIVLPIPDIKPDDKPIINTTPLPPKPEDPKKVGAVKKVISLSLEDLKASNPHHITDEHLLDWIGYRKKPITPLFWDEMNKTLSTLAFKGIYPEEAFKAMLKNRWGGIEELYFEKDIEYKNKKRSAYKNTVESVMRA